MNTKNYILYLSCFSIMLYLTACGASSYDPGESTAEACQDNTDNDGDQLIDCQDSDCSGYVFCMAPTEQTAVDCQDGQDNDSDGATDCDDTQCKGFVFCSDESGENTIETCSNGIDDDNDESTDCDDTECKGFEICAAPGTEESPSTCRDGKDNDSDGMTDCLDTDCKAFVFCMPGEENTSTQCTDDVDNDHDGMTDCDDPGCLGFIFCASDGEASASMCSDDLDNDNDGMTDCDDSECWNWGFCQHYHGYPLEDHWGETFDGLERPKLAWPEAKQVCESLGGRLPTVTELWRNNASTGSGDLSDDGASNPLWTIIASGRQNQRVTVTLSNGTVGYQGETNPLKFRCVWPDARSSGFDAKACYGSAESPCYMFDRLWNVDSLDRPAVDYAAAVNECAFYHASIPSVSEWGQLIHSGLDHGTSNWLWATDPMYWYNSNYGLALVRWTDAQADRWAFSNTDAWGTVDSGSSDRSFRCIGLAMPENFAVPDVTCEGNCFFTNSRKSPLMADSTDREAVDFAQAFEQCRQAGGDLPSGGEATELIHASWPSGSNEWIWLSQAMYWYNQGYGYAVFRWAGQDGTWWYYNQQFGERSSDSSLRPHRCVFRTQGPALPGCAPEQIVKWNGSQFECAQSQTGDSQDQAHVIQIVDDFNNAWDGIQRDQAVWSDAKADCEAIGGHLPTASELYAVRFENNPHDPIGDVTSTSYLWTTTSSIVANQKVLVRISDGASNKADIATSNYYRCIWPSDRGDILAASNCYGPPNGPCHDTGSGMLADKYDRVSVDMASAIEECAAVGGHIPDMAEMTSLIHSGLPNGTDNWLWVADPAYWYIGNYGYSLVKWSGEGMPEWSYTSPGTGSIGTANNSFFFRCAYSSSL